MASEQYCLRWNDHRTILLTNFERLLQSNSSVDCTLAAEGKCLRAHKVVLSACSPYLELMLNQDKEKHPIIFLKDMKFKELQAILEYMYRGEVVIPHDQLTSLLQVAESLQIKGLGCGEKSQPQSGNRGLIQTHPLQQPQPQPLPAPLQQQTLQQVAPKPVQVMRAPAPVIRGLEVTQVVREVAPQVVDLTDEPRPPVRTPPTPHALAHGHAHAPPGDAAKRPQAPPQGTPRAKRLAYPVPVPAPAPVAVPDRFNQTTASPITMQNVMHQQQNVVTNAGQLGGTTMMATPVPLTSVQTPPKASPVVSRPTNEPGGQSAVQVLMPPTQRPETHDIRDAGNQPEAQKVKPRTVPRILQRKPSAVQPSTAKTSSPVAMPSQNALVVSAPRAQLQTAPASETAPTAEANAAARAIANENAADMVGKTPTATTPPVVEQTNGSENEVRANETPIEPQDSLDPAADPAEDVVDEKPSLESPKDTAAKNSPASEKPGPSGVGKAKPGRRGRAPGAERRFQCTECDKRFTQRSYLENHLRIHDGECFECDNCTKTFLSRAALVKHLRAHAAKAASAASAASAPLPHKCQLCGAVFPGAADLERHLTEHTMAAADDP